MFAHSISTCTVTGETTGNCKSCVISLLDFRKIWGPDHVASRFSPLLIPHGQQGFKVRRFGLAVDHGGFDVAESRLAEKPPHFDFREAQPQVGVQFASLLVGVAHQIQHHDPAARLENSPRLRHRPLRMPGMVQRLAEERQIDGGRCGWARPRCRPGGIPGCRRRACAPAPRRTPPSFPSCRSRSPSWRAGPAIAKTCLRPRPDRRSPAAASAAAEFRPALPRSAPARSAARTCRPARRNTRASCPGAGAWPAAGPPNRGRLRGSPRRLAETPSAVRLDFRAAPCRRYRMLLPLRRSSTSPACFSCARCVEMRLCPIARISCSSATESSSRSTSSRIRSRLGSVSRRRFLRIDAIRGFCTNISTYLDL